MTPRLLLQPAAQADLADAFEWYEQRAVGLGHEYLRVVRLALAAIEKAPDQYPLVLDDIRRASIRRFPYFIFYVARSSDTSVNLCHSRATGSAPLAGAPLAALLRFVALPPSL